MIPWYYAMYVGSKTNSSKTNTFCIEGRIRLEQQSQPKKQNKKKKTWVIFKLKKTFILTFCIADWMRQQQSWSFRTEGPVGLLYTVVIMLEVFLLICHQIVVVGKAVQETRLTLDDYVFPDWSMVIAWLLVAFPLTVIVVFYLGKFLYGGGWKVRIGLEYASGGLSEGHSKSRFLKRIEPI